MVTGGNSASVNNIRNIKVNRQSAPKIKFGQRLVSDTFQLNSPLRFYNEVAIRKMISQNPEVRNILDKYKLPVHLNMNELQELKAGHCLDTQNIALEVLKHMPVSLAAEVNAANLKDAAILHDFGKVLIPPAVLNKNSKLTTSEYEVMGLHTELGYQLLKTTGINEDVLKLVRNHHNTFMVKDGKISFVPDVTLQILNLADKYSALTEKRTYKEAYTPQKALSIIAQEVYEGKVSPVLYMALTEAVGGSSRQLL